MSILIVLKLEVPLPICLGSVVKLTCITNGTNSLGWRYNNVDNAFYISPNELTQAPRSVGPFLIQLTCVRGSEFTSVATINVTSNLNGAKLDCADGLFNSQNTEIKSFTFSVKGKI